MAPSSQSHDLRQNLQREQTTDYDTAKTYLLIPLIVEKDFNSNLYLFVVSLFLFYINPLWKKIFTYNLGGLRSWVSLAENRLHDRETHGWKLLVNESVNSMFFFPSPIIYHPVCEC